MAHGGFETGRNVDFTLEGLARAERTVPSLVVQGGTAGGLAAGGGLHNDAAVQEILGLIEKLVEFATELPLLDRQRGWADGVRGCGVIFLRGSGSSRCADLTN